MELVLVVVVGVGVWSWCWSSVEVGGDIRHFIRRGTFNGSGVVSGYNKEVGVSVN